MSSPFRQKGKGKGREPDLNSELPRHSRVLSLTCPRPDEEPALIVHEGYLCSGITCPHGNAFIRGVRFQCGVCENKSFCSSCHEQPDNGHDPLHTLIECIGESEVVHARRLPNGQLVDENGIEIDTTDETYLIDGQALSNGFHELDNRSTPNVRPAPQSNGMTWSANHTRVDSKIFEPVVQHEQALNLQELGSQLFGSNNQIAADQLLTHWTKGVPAVRLIDLLPGKADDILMCLLTSTRLDRPEPYEVLCTAWVPNEAGKVESTSFICVGEQFCEIKEPTAEALKSIRSEKEIKKVWVEELCVQHDRPEFAAFQERSTSLIYNKAKETIVWADVDATDMGAAWTLIEMLSHRFESEDSVLPSPADLEDDPVLELLECLPIGSEKWTSLAKFYPPHLFVQGWMLHDVAFATKAIVKCGEYELAWWQVARVRDMLAQPSWMSLDWRQPWHNGKCLDRTTC